MRTLTREDVLGSRVRAQQLDRTDTGPSRAAVLDVGVQDTGPDGGRWALAVRGVEVPPDDLVLLWTIRGSPHLYRRADLPSVAAAVAPFSDADAAKRIYDASKPLKAARIAPRAALEAVAAVMRDLARAPIVKGDLSGRVAAAMPEPYLRDCVPCGVVHLHEMPFRLAAVRAGLELQPGTSPPVLQPMPPFTPLAEPLPQHDVVRGYLRLLGPATPPLVASYLDAPVADVKRRWPADAEEVRVGDAVRWLLDADTDTDAPAGPAETVRLLGPYDLFLQARDRDLLVPDPARRKALWPVLGRPGAVLVDGEVAGLWRPRQSGGRLRVLVERWQPMGDRVRRQVQEQAARLAEHRGVALAGVDGLE